MPLPSDLAEFCVDLRLAPGSFCVTLPGGAQACASLDFDAVDPSDLIKDLFAKVNNSLAPLVPIFDIIDFALAALNCIKAIPDALTVPPQPQKIAQCIPDLARKAQALIRLLPQFSIPILAKEILCNLIAFVEGVKSRLAALIAKSLRVIQSETRAATIGSVQLQTIVDCANGNLDNQLVNLNAGLTPLNRFIGLVNAFLDLVGLSCIPELNNIQEISQDAVAPLDALIELLENLKDLIPVKEPNFDLPGGFSKPCDTEAP